MRRFLNKIKKEIRTLKYLDRTKRRYYTVMVYIMGFCLFTGTTYSYFYLTKNLNAATLAIGRIRYSLSSTTEGYNNGVVSVGAKETKIVDLTLHSYNTEETRYALNYSGSSNVKVYYSQNLANNMSGTIGPSGSEIVLRVVIVNNGSSAEEVALTVKGGYIQNTLTTNITEGYYESDLTVRAILLDENLENGVLANTFPVKGGEYGYYKTVCNNSAFSTWDSVNWKFQAEEMEGRTSCDVYFKKIKDDIETYFIIQNTDGTVKEVTSIPNDGTYEFKSATCSNGSTATWNTSTWKLQIDEIGSKTICSATFIRK